MFSVSFPCFIPSFLIIFHACSNAGLFKFIYINPYGHISHLSKTLRVFLCRSLLSHASHGSLSATCHSRLSHALRGPLSMTFRYISRKHFVFSRVITVCFAELMTSSLCHSRIFTQVNSLYVVNTSCLLLSSPSASQS